MNYRMYMSRNRTWASFIARETVKRYERFRLRRRRSILYTLCPLVRKVGNRNRQRGTCDLVNVTSFSGTGVQQLRVSSTGSYFCEEACESLLSSKMLATPSISFSLYSKSEEESRRIIYKGSTFLFIQVYYVGFFFALRFFYRRPCWQVTLCSHSQKLLRLNQTSNIILIQNMYERTRHVSRQFMQNFE